MFTEEQEKFWSHLFSKLKKLLIPILLLVLYFVLSNYFTGHYCPSMVFFGIPCPACGMTRALVLFLKGEFSNSLKMNPMVLPFIIFILLYHRYNKNKAFIKGGIVFLILVFFVFFYRMKLYFPNVQPLVLNENAPLYDLTKILLKILGY